MLHPRLSTIIGGQGVWCRTQEEANWYQAHLGWPIWEKCQTEIIWSPGCTVECCPIWNISYGSRSSSIVCWSYAKRNIVLDQHMTYIKIISMNKYDPLTWETHGATTAHDPHSVRQIWMVCPFATFVKHSYVQIIVK
jgi:hypothetical protein